MQSYINLISGTVVTPSCEIAAQAFIDSPDWAVYAPQKKVKKVKK